MDLLAKLKLFFVSADPGRVGLRMGLRVMLTVACVCLALLAIGFWIPMNAPSYVIGIITAIQGAAQINDASRTDRALTRVYAAIGGFIAVAGISFVQSSLVLIDAWLLLVIFLSTYVRRLGARWQAVGMFSFMCAVMSSFLKAPESALIEIALALIVSGLVAHLLREYVLPEQPARDFRRVVDSTVALSETFRKMIDGLGSSGDRRGWKELLRLSAWLRRDIRMCQNYLPLKAVGESDERNISVMLRLLDLQLAAELALEAPSAKARSSPEANKSVKTELNALAEAEQRLQQAMAELPASFPEGHSPPTHGSELKLFPDRGAWLKDEPLRIALQATLACAIAMVGGRLISSDRWFWAVLTAFLIFMNTQSAGAVAVRGISRAAGTLAGVTLGIVLATMLRGDLYLTIPLIGIAIFGAFYLVRISYAWMNVCINVAIALIYGLVGIFRPELLILRLEETGIGAAAGIFAALALLPVRTTQSADQAMSRFFLSLKSLLHTITNGEDEHRNKSMTAASSAVDQAFAGVLRAYEPMRSVWTLGTVEAKTHAPLRRAYLLSHAAHLLQRSFRHSAPTGAELQELRAIEDRLGTVAGNRKVNEPSVAITAGDIGVDKVEVEVPDEPVRYALALLGDTLREIEAGD